MEILLRVFLIIFQIYKITNDTHIRIDKTAIDLKEFEIRINELQNNRTNDNHIAQALKNSSKKIDIQSEKISQELNSLRNEYDKTQNKLNKSLVHVKDSEQKAQILSNRANQLMSKVGKIFDSMTKLKSNEKYDNLDGLKNEIDSLINYMNTYTNKIEQQAEYYKTCT